ncbi:fumarate hydratase subunit beta [Sporobacter termitidis DSM 10068]|uniref:Fumarate hydratase subunit beta n=1 Tax=Sporobacter termitidis DSM 10068 TaxID=1123282 RepID=A0A1M5Y187_9FIRM|nr:FumA C-terminus/TtdB family hydratase beta subunit [Sporobacter termitidis]SHI05830.1 fumarate hydratase subunit beta [Sporobacter termitidis DSM 10068]
MNTYTLTVPELRLYTDRLRAGDRVYLSGAIYTARDAAHKKIFALLESGAPLPFDVKDAVIYYAGPTPGHDGVKIGSCGPTTSSRMDGFASRLYDLGLAATIGKGERGDSVRDAIIRNRAAYLCAVGGAGALISRHITNAEELAFPELGCESVKRLTIDRMPLVAALDIFGGDIFREGREKYKLA